MKEVSKIKKLLKLGITKKYFCKTLSLSAPTLDKRLKDGKFSSLQKEKIKSISL